MLFRSMEIFGNYECEELQSNLIISPAEGYNPDGPQPTSARGTISIGGVSMEINITMNQEMTQQGPVTDLAFSGSRTEPSNYFIAGVGRVGAPEFFEMEVAGGYPTATGVKSFSGNYRRV